MADPQERGRGLPPGVARTVNTNGHVEFVDHFYSNNAFEAAAFRLLVQEANRVAQALRLDEDLPITASKIVRGGGNPFGLYYDRGMMGSVATTNYTYRVLSGGKLDRVEIDRSYEVWRSLQEELLPENQVDNQGAYRLATQWLSSISVDVNALNRDCQLTVASSPVLNYVGSGDKPIRRMFAPTYDITWKSTNGPAAYVQLYLPDKLLIQLSLDDPKFNLRPPLVFTNLAALFPGQVVIRTNYLVTPIVIDVGAHTHGPSATFVTDSGQPEPLFHELSISDWIETKTVLNTNRLPLSQLMALKQISGPDEWGVVEFELPIRFELGSSESPSQNGDIDLGSFNADGDFIECTFSDSEKSPNGNTRLWWNINWNAPGKHELRARLTYSLGIGGGQFTLIGPALSFNSSNTCRFYEASTLFNSDGADLYAKLRETSAKFRVEVRSIKGRLINDISSSTTNGEINLAWDLTGLDGNKFTNNSFIGSFFVTYPQDTQTNPPVKARFNKVGTAGE